jgi:hypothetical protein
MAHWVASGVAYDLTPAALAVCSRCYTTVGASAGTGGKCDKCNVPENAGGCKCDANCDCIAKRKHFAAALMLLNPDTGILTCWHQASFIQQCRNQWHDAGARWLLLKLL